MSNAISRDELKSLIERGEVQAVEALPAGHYEERHLPGAVNLPHDAPNEEVARVLPDKSAAIVTYCASPTCQNSAQLAQRLDRLGYADVREYAQGKSDWVEAGLPTEEGASVAADGSSARGQSRRRQAPFSRSCATC